MSVRPGDSWRHLVAERLAAAGRHHHQRVASIESCPDRLCLQRTETLETPEAAHGGKDFVGPVRSRSRAPN